MIERCTSPKNISYHNYGGRGIRVCARWRKFENFLADMGKRPSAKYSIERKDNNGDYTPKNCKWATRHEQHRNMRKNVWITFEGVTLCLKDWERRLGMGAMTLKGRLARGWSVRDALTLPPDKSASCGRYHRARSLAMTSCKWGHTYPQYMYLKPIIGTNKVAKCCRECDRLRQQRIRESRRAVQN